jgi:ABC-type branched-subunit amino acid transport system permease subunit
MRGYPRLPQKWAFLFGALIILGALFVLVTLFLPDGVAGLFNKNLLTGKRVPS